MKQNIRLGKARSGRITKEDLPQVAEFLGFKVVTCDVYGERFNVLNLWMRKDPVCFLSQEVLNLLAIYEA